MTPIIAGTVTPIRGRTKISYDPQHGLQIGIPWESAGDNLVGLANQYIQARVAFDLESNAKKSSLIAKPTGGQLGFPNLSTDEWQLLPNELQLSLLEHPRALGITPAEKDIIDTGLGKNPPTPVSEIDLEGYAAVLYDRLRRGISHFPISQPVLRHTTNCDDTYQGNIANDHVEKIYTTAQLLQECGNASLWTFPLPGSFVAAIQAVLNRNFFVEREGWLIGWRKLAPSYATAAANRTAIHTEYWFGQWDLFVYDPLT